MFGPRVRANIFTAIYAPRVGDFLGRNFFQFEFFLGHDRNGLFLSSRRLIKSGLKI